jgi:hypothetical protein
MNTMSSRPRMHYQSNVLNPTQSATPVDAGLRWEWGIDAGVIYRPEDVLIKGAFHVPYGDMLAVKSIRGGTWGDLPVAR